MTTPAQTLDQPSAKAPKSEVMFFFAFLVQIPQGEDLIGLVSLQLFSTHLLLCCFVVTVYHTRNEADPLREKLVVGSPSWRAGTIEYF